MRIEILSVAMSDIQSGQNFYEAQQEGLGAYFLDSLFSDIDSLLLYAGIHQQFFGYHRALSKRFPYAIYYQVNDKSFKFGACWTADKNHHAQAVHYEPSEVVC